MSNPTTTPTAPATVPASASVAQAGELMAAALGAHRTLARGRSQSVPLTALGPHGDPRALAAFVAVYAAQQHASAAPAPGHAA